MKRIMRLLAVSAFVTSLAASPVAFAANGDNDASQPPGTMGGTSGDETPVQYLDDAAITAKVKTAFVVDPDLKARDISVETTQGIVRLMGTVDSQAEKDKAMNTAQKISGVKSLKDDLVVRGAEVSGQ
jgi:osmotically-inducible protein OsmY